MPDPVEVAGIIDRALAIARDKGVTGSDEDVRRRLAERLFRELRVEERLSGQ
jgi:hypothetical protein